MTSKTRNSQRLPGARGPMRSSHARWLAGVVLMGITLCLLTGCLSPRYEHASNKSPPAVMLNASFPPAPLKANLNTLIVPDGPGSWKKSSMLGRVCRYGSQFRRSTVSRRIDGVGGLARSPRAPGDDPWKLERESKSLAKRYGEAGMTVVRVAAPRVLVTAAESQALQARQSGKLVQPRRHPRSLIVSWSSESGGGDSRGAIRSCRSIFCKART